MANLWFTLAVCAIALATLSRADEDLKLIKAICAKNNDNLLKDLALCEDSFGSDNVQACFKEHNQRPDELKDEEKGTACVFTAFLKNDAMDLLGIGF
nr:uncharacterized protein LOC107451422 [Parasteatoda tepidariorum]